MLCAFKHESYSQKQSVMLSLSLRPILRVWAGPGTAGAPTGDSISRHLDGRQGRGSTRLLAPVLVRREELSDEKLRTLQPGSEIKSS